MRAFLAVPLEDRVRRRLAAWQRAWADRTVNVKWVEQENLHLTLKFLGEVKEQDLEALTAVVAKVVESFSPFSVVLGGPGVFPNLKRARVLWVGLKDDAGRLAALARKLEQGLVPLGFPPEKQPFTPHLTLGRLRQPAPVSFLTLEPENKRLTMKVEEVVLYRSVLRPDGPIYQVLKRFSLDKPK